MRSHKGVGYLPPEYTASRVHERSLRLRASSQAHYGVDEDEEWWPGRVLGVHSQGAHAGLFDVLYDDGELQTNLP